MTEWKYTLDLDDEFFSSLAVMCKRLNCTPLHMLKVMHFESGVQADPPHNNLARGIIQFLPTTLDGLGFPEALDITKLNATEQLQWVEKYFSSHAPYGLESVAKIYLATFMPALLRDPRSKDPAFVICGQAGPYKNIYQSNRAFDAKRKGFVTVQDLEDAAETHATGARWNELTIRLGVAEGSETLPIIPTWQGVQSILTKLGHYRGKIDGVPGPKTLKAVFVCLVKKDNAA